MSVRFFYIDESYNDGTFCLTGLSIRHTHWKECFDMVKDHRRQLKATYGIPLSKEIHARNLVRGRGSLGPNTIGKWQRSRIFLGLLSLVAKLPTAKLFNVCLPQKGLPDAQMKAWDRIINRIERTMKYFEDSELRKRTTILGKLDARHGSLTAQELKDLKNRLHLFRSRAFIIADEGREHEITTALRRMHIHNLIPSQFREWEPGVTAKNITTDRIIEDPVFKPSHRSYFLQLADCVAFALLKQEVLPTPNVKKYGIHQMFRVLEPICYVAASPKDPQGIVRK